MDTSQYEDYHTSQAYAFTCLIGLATSLFRDRVLIPRGIAAQRIGDLMVDAARTARKSIVASCNPFSTFMDCPHSAYKEIACQSLQDLAGDYEAFLVEENAAPWQADDPHALEVKNLAMDSFTETEDVPHHFGVHLQNMSKRFDPWMQHEQAVIAARSLIVTIERTINLIAMKTLDCLAPEDMFADGSMPRAHQHAILFSTP